MNTESDRFIRIAAGCIENERGEILICQRPAHKIYPGEWEFPGGKLEAGEDAKAALRRELHEELEITVRHCHPLIRLRHVYPELSVDLDVWKVLSYEGELQPNEHPRVAWVAPDELPGWKLLAADQPIVNALRLPSLMVVTPPVMPQAGLAPVLEAQGRCLLRLRSSQMDDAQYADTARRLSTEVRAAGNLLVVDRDPSLVESGIADGFHTTSSAMSALQRRPVAAPAWFGASCHDAREVGRATELGADYVVIGPVSGTATHPGAEPIGWQGFESLARLSGVPAYAIGGVSPDDIDIARNHGAVGIAGISAFFGPGSN